MKQPPVHSNLTPIDRPTVGKVVDRVGATIAPQARSMKALTKGQIKGDNSVSDFLTWILNFDVNRTGHFHDDRCCQRFGEDVLMHIRLMGGKVSTGPEAEKLLVHIRGELAIHFVEQGAADDFARQVSEYIEADGFIGVSDGPVKKPRKSRPRGKTSGQSGKPRSRNAARVRKST